MESCVRAMQILTTPWRARALLCMVVTAAVVPHAAAQLGSAQHVSVTTLAGSGVSGYLDGIGTAASFSGPYGMDVSSDGKSLYVADWLNFCVRKINIETAEVSTLAGSCGSEGFVDGTGTAARFRYVGV